MSDGDPLVPYLKLRRERPELFRNLPGGIDILDGETEVAGVPVGLVYQDPYITVVRDPVRFPDSVRGTYIRVLDSANATGTVTLPLLGPDVVLVEHFRHATRSWHVEVPRGFGVAGSSSTQNAARELAEEIGAVARELIPLGRVHPDTGLLGGHVDLFAARIDALGEPDRGEGVRRVFTVPAAAAEGLVGDGRITDAFTIAALSRARLAGLLG